MALRIVLAGGGSGGHLFPLTTVKKYIRENYKGKSEFLFLGPKTDLEMEVMKKHKIPHKWVLCGKLHRYMTFQYVLDIIKVPIGILQALWHLLRYMPNIVFSKGGFASVPVVIAARFYRIPVLIHESDSIPGLANKFLGSISNKIAITFERARIYFPVHKTILTGVPVRKEVIGGDPQKARELLGIHKEVKPVVFVIGGSQGAQLINEKIMFNLAELLKHYQVIHQTGSSHFDLMKYEAETRGFKIGHCDYYPIAFIGDEIGHIFALADIVISRAGATAISELAANNKASILVPITKSANQHQRINAFEVSKVGGAIVLEESNFRRTMLFHNLKKIISDKDLNQKLSKNIGKFYQADATEKIAGELLKLAGK
ncbi:MAG: UDP-N-acetylglucosamine--N-acetylmuramyl-(pentapeptide) pyrophosphoryl-undecaprenol N-acetylglucosamine transferase [Patescibacteria group bacterium]|nr:UDP-N-acetylglucosamine--N-acetylmuramyl-(pentapeptide) pyrophosphoryl-undecaprenol N-acetylglucosamine transferase [Patescibacteria group bacterium]